MAIKLEPDDDGIVRISMADKLVEVETGSNWRGGFPFRTIDSSNFSPAADWRGGNPVFTVKPILDDTQVQAVIENLERSAGVEGASPDQVILFGVTRFEPDSLVRLVDVLDSDFAGAKLVLDFDQDSSDP